MAALSFDDLAPAPEATEDQDPWIGSSLGLVADVENSAGAAARQSRITGKPVSPDDVVSPTGAVGIHQIEPGTAAQLGFDPARLHDHDYNANVGRAILSQLRDRYTDDSGNVDLSKVLIAYNAGPGRADKWNGDPSTLPKETQGYLARARTLRPDLFPAPQKPGAMSFDDLASPPKAMSFDDLAAKAPAEMPNPLTAIVQGIVASGREVGQTLGAKGAPETSPAAQPYQWSDLLHPESALSKTAYGLGKGAPMIAGGIVGTAAGGAIPGAGETGIPELAGGAVGAGLGTVIQTLGPAYEAELKRTPNDPDGAFDRALRTTELEGGSSAISWAAFGYAPFKSAVKNTLLQAFGIQPGIAVTTKAAENKLQGRPLSEDLGATYVSSVPGTLVPAAGHAIASVVLSRLGLHDQAQKAAERAHDAGIQQGAPGARKEPTFGPAPPQEPTAGRKEPTFNPEGPQSPIPPTTTIPQYVEAGPKTPEQKNVEQALDQEPAAPPPGPSWKNAHVIEQEHDDDVRQLETQGFVDADRRLDEKRKATALPFDDLAPQQPTARPLIDRRDIEPGIAVTAAGREVPVHYAIVEADHLVPSQTPNGGPNPLYPAELQPRDRSRAVSSVQIADIANHLDPRLLDRTPLAIHGAPIVSPDGIVESGNGRTLAVQSAYEQGIPTAAAYRDYLAQQGYPVEGMQKPMLVRVRAQDMTPEERQAFTREANQSGTMGMSATERAMNDAAALPDAALDLYAGGDVDLARNRPFVRRFMDAAVDKSEHGGMIGPDGQLSSDAVRRIQGALLAKAYGDPKLLAAILEAPDANIQAIGGALTDTAAEWAKLRAAARNGEIPADMDQTGALLDAVRIVRHARAEERNIAEYVGQRDMLTGAALGEDAEAFLRLMFRNTKNWTQPVGREKLGEALGFYVTEATKAGVGTDMLGETAPTPQRILALAKERQYPGPTEQPGIFDRPSAGNGPRVRPPRGSGEGPTAEGAAPGGGAPHAAAGRAVAPDFPDAIVQRWTNDKVRVSALPGFDKAKSGDVKAAHEIVKRAINPAKVEAIRRLIGNRRPTLVAVHAIEATGRNVLPEVYATHLGQQLGLPVDTDIVQAGVSNRRNAKASDRLVRRVPFDGNVEPGREYLLVDDHITQGGTLADLASHIESRGGKVIGATSLTASQLGHQIKPREGAIEALRKKFGSQLEDWWKEKFGNGFDVLTASEARQLGSYPTADAVRNRFAKDAQGTGPSGDAGAAAKGPERPADIGVRAGLPPRPDTTDRADMAAYRDKALAAAQSHPEDRDALERLADWAQSHIDHMDHRAVIERSTPVFHSEFRLSPKKKTGVPQGQIEIVRDPKTGLYHASIDYNVPGYMGGATPHRGDHATAAEALDAARKEIVRRVSYDPERPDSARSKTSEETMDKIRQWAESLKLPPQPQGPPTEHTIEDLARQGARDILDPSKVDTKDRASLVAYRERALNAAAYLRHTADDRAGADEAFKHAEWAQKLINALDGAEKKPGYGDKNTVFTKDAADKARELLRKKMQGGSGFGKNEGGSIDTELIHAGITLAGYHVEAGARAFGDFAKAMLNDLGEWSRPYLKMWYNAVRDYPDFDGAGMTPAHEITPEAIANVSSGSPDLERDSTRPPAADEVRPAPVSTSAGPAERGSGEGGKPPGEPKGSEAEGGNGIPDRGAAAVGKPSDSELQAATSAAAGDLAQPDGPQRDAGPGSQGIPPDRLGADTVARPAEDAGSVGVAAPADIRRDLPELFPEQQDDVAFAETRFDAGEGVLFTNGTGTGKTFTGAGIAKRFWMRGKQNILVVAPTQGILSHWQEAMDRLKVPFNVLDSTSTHGGSGPVGTTYANLAANKVLGDRDWDLVVADESHSLMSQADGNETQALRAFRAVTKFPDALHALARMRLRQFADPIDELERAAYAAQKRHDHSGAREMFDRVGAMNKELEPKIQAMLPQLRALDRAKAAFLSATPFAYDKTVDYGNGYLFDYGPPPKRSGYNTPTNPRDAFMMQHFGYRMRYGKLTKPDSAVESDVMERQFHEWLRSQGALAGRVLNVDKDYDRKFQLIDDGVGHKIDKAFDFLWKADGGKFRELADAYLKQFDYLSRMRLLEAIKATHAVPIIQEHHALGRKVVVFHDYNEGGGFSPFEADQTILSQVRGGKRLHDEFLSRNPYVGEINEAFRNMRTPIETMKRAFPDALIYNGTVSKKVREQARNTFNRDAGPSGKHANLIVVQSAAGQAGISLHDTTGRHMRVLMNLGMPGRPTTAIQEEGRIYRIGQASNAPFRYLNTGTNWERFTFADRLAQRAGTAENLALGDRARRLRDSFIEAFNDSGHYAPSDKDGIGGKAQDRRDAADVNDFDRARSYYFAQGKKTSRNKSAEGTDYFATPEPIGLKMVQFADIRPGESVLEPSAGHGAISRFFPETAARTLVEPSDELASRAALSSPGAKVLNHRFEDLHAVNKFDAIVMNPPFGVGGKTAMEHLAKAADHLRDHGRIVAIIPEGPSADGRFEKFMESPAAKSLYLRSSMRLPAVTFERAGTAARGRIVVLEKQTTPELADRVQQTDRDYSSAETIGALFDRIRDAGIPERARPVGQPTQEPAIREETVGEKPPSFLTRDTTHGKTGAPLFVAVLDGRVPRESYERLNALAKRHGGYYSAFRGTGAVPGFQFKSNEARVAFLEDARPKPSSAQRLSSEYQRALDRSRVAEKKFTEARNAFRAGTLSNSDFAAAQAAYKAEQRLFDEAFEKEQRFKTEPGAVDAKGNALPQTIMPGMEGSERERIAAEIARREGRGKLEAKKAQKPADIGLFSKPGETPPGKGGQGTLFQRGYHGSPHDFDAFDNAHIGSGEGVQAYGFGHYIAGEKDVAKTYRDMNAARGRRGYVGELARMALEKAGGDRAKAVSDLRRAEALHRSTPPGSPRGFGESVPVWGASPDEMAARSRDAADLLESGKPIFGRLYTVQLEPKEDEWLDLDKKLSEQSPKVREALGKMATAAGDSFRRGDDVNGHEFYRMLAREWGTPEYASEALRQAGIPGLRYADMESRLAAARRGETGTSHNFVVFDPRHISILSREQRAPVFFSGLTRAVEGLRTARATPEQWRNTIRNLAGVKKEEIDWSDVNDWLAQQHGPVTKEQVLDHIRANEVQVKESVRGEGGTPVAPTDMDAVRHWLKSNLGSQSADEYEPVLRDAATGNDTAIGQLEEAGVPSELIQPIYDNLDRMRATKFGSYTLPGGKNYRELLLTLPWLRGARGYQGSHFPEPNVLVHLRFDDRTGPNGERDLHVAEFQSDWHQRGRKEGYAGKNTERDRERAALIEEREKAAAEGKYIQGHPEHADAQARYGEINRRLVELGTDSPRAVPDAPFKTSWPELAMKRMIRYAAENGYDRISWDTGDTSAERYDLSKHVETIDYFPRDDGKFDIEAIRKGEKEATPIMAAASRESLANLVGKEIADRMTAGEGRPLRGPSHGWKRFDGLDLKVGGEGMRGFYDRTLPAIANKIGKKWGAKVDRGPMGSRFDVKKEGEGYRIVDRDEKLPATSHTFPSEQAAWEWLNPQKDLRPADSHSLPITPAMREAVVDQGQPLFQMARNERIRSALGEIESLAMERGENLRGPRGGVEGQALARFANTHADKISDEALDALRDRAGNLTDESVRKARLSLLEDERARQVFGQRQIGGAYFGSRERLAADLVGTAIGNMSPGEKALADAVQNVFEKIAPGAEVRAMRHLESVAPGDRMGNAISGATYRNGFRDVIAWSLESPDPIGTGRHEAVHWLLRSGLFTDQEWEILHTGAMVGNWMNDHDIGTRYADLPFETQIEEAIAEQYALWRRGETRVPKPVHAIFRKVREALAQIADHIRRLIGGNVTANDVFSRIESGEIGRRSPGDVRRHDAAQFQRPKIEGEEPRALLRPINRILGAGVDSVGHKLANAIDRYVPDPWKDLAESFKRNIAPMASGSPRARADAKDFANALRASRWEWNRVDGYLEKHWTPEQRKLMWDAADEESVIRQRGQEPKEGEGLSRLTPEQRADVEELQERANGAFAEAKRMGMTRAEGLPSYVPRMVVLMTRQGARTPGGPRGAGRGNLRTSTAQLLHRKYLEVGETQAAAQNRLGESAEVVHDIRTLSLATAKLQQAIAGRALINRIKAAGDSAGETTVHDGVTNHPENYFTMDHPAFRVWRPEFVVNDEGKVVPRRDEAGQIVFRSTPLYVSREYQGPLEAVMSQPTSQAYKFLMQLKGKMMSTIMYSPLMHNAVIWGKAIPAAPLKVLGFKVYFDGNKAKNDPATMREALAAGLDPIGRRYFNQDLTAIVEGPQIAPGRSWTSQVLAAVPNLYDRAAGDAVKRFVDRAGDVWHNTFLWDRVADLQMGLYTTIRDSEMKAGLDAQSAQRLAAHFSNRYAGSLPIESMSKVARGTANLMLFSRSFTLGNAGAWKDSVMGLPRDMQAQILRDRGIATLDQVQGEARRKAISMLVMDIALSHFGLLLASGAAFALRQALNQPGGFQTPGDNEPGKEQRFFMGYGRDGEALYGRLPTGKVGEELWDWVTEPRELLLRKLSPFGQVAYAVAANAKDDYGHKLFDPYSSTPAALQKDALNIGEKIADSMAPMGVINGLYDLAAGKGDTGTVATQTLLPAAGITVSKGAPGGPAQGEIGRAKQEHEYQVQQAMPAIREQIRSGDVTAARAAMRALGMPPGLIDFYVRTTRNPAAKPTPREMRDFRRYATPEQLLRVQQDTAQ